MTSGSRARVRVAGMAWWFGRGFSQLVGKAGDVVVWTRGPVASAAAARLCYRWPKRPPVPLCASKASVTGGGVVLNFTAWSPVMGHYDSSRSRSVQTQVAAPGLAAGRPVPAPPAGAVLRSSRVHREAHATHSQGLWG